jgi:hypothetical protein
MLTESGGDTVGRLLTLEEQQPLRGVEVNHVRDEQTRDPADRSVFEAVDRIA